MPARDRGPELAAVTGVFLGLAAISVLLRCYVRLFILRIFRPEDWFAVTTLVAFIAYNAVVSASIVYGAGKHLDDVSLASIPKVLSMRFAGEITYVATTTALKATVGIFLLRICSQTWHRVTIWTVLTICTVFNVIYFFLTIFQCRPVRYFWDQYTDPSLQGSCLPGRYTTGLTYAFSGVNAGGDWFFASIPIALVRNLELGRRQKISVAGILAMGVIASAATIVRIFYVWQIEQGGDVLYEFTDFAIWSTVENGLGLIASSFATLRPLFKRYVRGASQYRLSQQYGAQRKSTLCANKHGSNNDRNAGIELCQPTHAVKTTCHPHSDDDDIPLSPAKHSWLSHRSCPSDKDIPSIEYPQPLSPREARAHFQP